MSSPVLDALAASEAAIAATRREIVKQLFEENQRLRQELGDVAGSTHIVVPCAEAESEATCPSSNLVSCTGIQEHACSASAWLNAKATPPENIIHESARVDASSLEFHSAHCSAEHMQAHTLVELSQSEHPEQYPLTSEETWATAALAGDDYVPEHVPRKHRHGEDDVLKRCFRSSPITISVRTTDGVVSYFVHKPMLSTLHYFDVQERWPDSELALPAGLRHEDFEHLLLRLYRGYWPNGTLRIAQVVLCEYLQCSLHEEALTCLFDEVRTPADLQNILECPSLDISPVAEMLKQVKQELLDPIMETLMEKALRSEESTILLKMCSTKRALLGLATKDATDMLDIMERNFNQLVKLTETPYPDKFMCSWGSRRNPHVPMACAIPDYFGDLWAIVHPQLDSADTFASAAKFFHAIRDKTYHGCVGGCPTVLEVGPGIVAGGELLQSAFCDTLCSGIMLVEADIVESAILTDLLLEGVPVYRNVLALGSAHLERLLRNSFSFGKVIAQTIVTHWDIGELGVPFSRLVAERL